MKPKHRPRNPAFGSGPTAKRPGWSLDALEGALIARSHRSGPAKARIAEVIERSRDLLGLPSNYRLAIVPGSNTGAFEMALWTLLGSRGVDVLSWESFGAGWATDIEKQLKVKDLRKFSAPYGELPELSQVGQDRDVVFVWNGTTSGVRVPNGDWIAPDRKGLTLCDATSALFGMEIAYDRLDCFTYSWQKVLGGEAAHGMIGLGPRAVERLESAVPPWPLPKVFRLTKGGKLEEGPFKGETINTPSMLCVEDALDGLRWAEKEGGGPGLIRRTRANYAVIEKWVERTEWVDFLAARPEIRSPTSICLKVVDPAVTARSVEEQGELIKRMVKLLSAEKVAYDIAGYRDAPPGLRIWGGATVGAEELEALTPWLDWAFAEARNG
ncbi:MAG: phosphoserine transaminase [Gemmatimonadetes bacterium]|nr:phosphoserine transaminase [Gemmatimonadota bacterium]